VDGLYVEGDINISNYCACDRGVRIMMSSSKSDKVKLLAPPQKFVIEEVNQEKSPGAGHTSANHQKYTLTTLGVDPNVRRSS
jgi:hypothetical protein